MFAVEDDEVEQVSLTSLRWSIYVLLIIAALGSLTGRIWHVSGAEEKTPFLSANDRSRWCTVRSLVEHGTYAIDGITQERGWHTIDKVQHVGRDGHIHVYS
ncbi:MAG: hypothetical protein KDA60_22825, partial [Planctomycetales bacterium]|nr:hypothetical protein [Planctomycetales bacterium]